MKKFLNGTALFWGPVAFAGILVGWWNPTAGIVQILAALLLFLLTRERRKAPSHIRMSGE